MKNTNELDLVLFNLREAHLEHLPRLKKLLVNAIARLGLANEEGGGEVQELSDVIAELAATLFYVSELEAIAEKGAELCHDDAKRRAPKPVASPETAEKQREAHSVRTNESEES